MTDTKPQGLSHQDVQRLMADPSDSTRADTTAKIADQFSTGLLSPSERQIAEDIFRALVKDAAVLVRESLSAHLQSNPDVPHDVALSLAKDVESVALPIIRSSEVLTDEDLIEIVQGQNSAKQVAVAQRPTVSAQVADALIDTGNETAVARLVANEGADLTENALNRVMTEYEGVEAVSDSLVRRVSLPAAISEQLVSTLTQQLQGFLQSQHEVPADVASNLILQTRERATMSLVQYGSTDTELDDLIEQLYRKERLTSSLLLRALCMGDVNFFERALARMAKVPLQNARILIHDQGRLGLESLYIKAGLPQRMLPAFQAGLTVASETEYDGGRNDRQRFIERMLERMLTLFEDPDARLSNEDIDYLMGKLRQVAA